MRRRTLLAAGTSAAATLLAGCTSSRHRATGPAGPSSGPQSAAPPVAVATWVLTGGFLSSGLIAIRPPKLAVYADGTAIADAAYRTRLAGVELTELVDRLLTDLAAPWSPHGISVVDVPTTVLTVRRDAQPVTASALGLEELRGGGTYPDRFYDARDRLDAVRRRAVDGRVAYTGTRVRLVVVPDVAVPGRQPGDARPWPAGVPLPVSEAPGGLMQADLDATVARQLPADWTRYRTASGEPVSAAWRWLLPDE
jgi:hypothetical protein